MYVSMYVCIYVCMYVCMYIWVEFFHAVPIGVYAVPHVFFWGFTRFREISEYPNLIEDQCEPGSK